MPSISVAAFLSFIEAYNLERLYRAYLLACCSNNFVLVKVQYCKVIGGNVLGRIAVKVKLFGAAFDIGFSVVFNRYGKLKCVHSKHCLGIVMQIDAEIDFRQRAERYDLRIIE